MHPTARPLSASWRIVSTSALLSPGAYPGRQSHLRADRARERAVRALQLRHDREVVEAGGVDDIDRRAQRAPRRREVVGLAVVLRALVGAHGEDERRAARRLP